MHPKHFTKKTLPVPNTTNFLTYLDNDQDTASVLVLLHGWMERKEHFFPLIEALPASLITHTRLILPDLRGHGESSKHSQTSYRIEAFWDDILALLVHEQLTTKSLSFIGHSFGGIVALLTAKSLEPAVKRVFLLNTHPGQHANPPLLSLLTFASTLSKTLTAYQIRRLGAFNPADPALLNVYLASIRQTPRFVIRRLSLETIHRSLFSFMSEVTFPLVVVTGALDRLAPPAIGELFRSLAPACEHVVLPDVGHYTPLVVPNRIAQLILSAKSNLFTDELEEPLESPVGGRKG